MGEATRPIPKLASAVYIGARIERPVTKSTPTVGNQPKSSNFDGFETVRSAVLSEALSIAVFEGWSDRALSDAGKAAGVGRSTLRAAFPHGAIDLLSYWSSAIDEQMLISMASPGFAGLKIRERVTHAILARLSALRSDKEAARRAAAFLALPPHISRAIRLTWRTSDAIWRGLDDKSTDFNFYSKRAILSGVWTSTFAKWLADETENEAVTRGFLKGRIENVMTIEKLKAHWREKNVAPLRSIETLARMRYRDFD